MMFGTKSEKVTREIEQLELKLEELETRQSERAATTSTVADWFAEGGNTGAPSTGCDHSANCAYSSNAALLTKLAGGGSGCNNRATFVPFGQPGGLQINFSNWNIGYLLLMSLSDDGSSVSTSYGPTTLGGQQVPNPN